MISMAELLKSAGVIVLWHFFLFVVTKIRRRARNRSSSLADANTNYPAAVTRFEYDVFLSYSGEDTGRRFTDHLYAALHRNGIRVFRDREEIKKGDMISETLVEAIRASAIAIPIFSKSYADSSWCLRELAAIMDCRRLVLPVFYDVEPREVRHPEASENFKMAFMNHKRRFGRKTANQWKDAMTQPAEASGYDSKSVVDGREAKMIEMIVERVLKELKDWIPSKLPNPDLIGSTANGYCTSIIQHLKDPTALKIGVWGMGGSGKTCIVRNVYNRLHEECYGLFDHIILVTVPYPCNLKDVRNEIGKQLLIRKLLDEENELTAAAFLKKRLEKKKFLLILDDLWRRVDLEELGVPEPTQHNGCKILVTARNHGVCSSMNTGKEVKVVPLPYEEAWELFCHSVGELPKGVEQLIARKIAYVCDGLPLAIVTVAESLRNQSDHMRWNIACLDLFHSKPLDQTMKEQVFERLKLSYDRLERQDLKDGFLSSVFYIGKDKLRSVDLVSYLMAEGLAETQDNIDICRPMGNAIGLPSKLKEVCLLEECEDREFLRINTVMRSMALHMLCSSIFISDDPGTEDPPSPQKWEIAKKISFTSTHISRLSLSPSCSTGFKALLLRRNFRLNHISDSFFLHMESLCVLDLSFADLTSLPSSLSCLVNLRFLCLAFCQSLKTVDQVGGLKRLIFLFLRGSAIEKLPKEISGLKKLRILGLEGTIRLKEIENGAISGLSSLESLFMQGSAYRWSLEGTSTGASLREIGNLSHLMTVELNVLGEDDFEYIRAAAITNKCNRLESLKCYISESRTLMEFNGDNKTWEGKVEEDDPRREHFAWDLFTTTIKVLFV